jgi:hypothetical protein
MTKYKWGGASIALALLAITGVLFWQGQHYMMQIHYNMFLLSLAAMALALVLLVWNLGAGENGEER